MPHTAVLLKEIMSHEYHQDLQWAALLVLDVWNAIQITRPQLTKIKWKLGVKFKDRDQSYHCCSILKVSPHENGTIINTCYIWLKDAVVVRSICSSAHRGCNSPPRNDPMSFHNRLQHHIAVSYLVRSSTRLLCTSALFVYIINCTYI